MHNHFASALLTHGDHKEAEKEIRLALAQREASQEQDPLDVATEGMRVRIVDAPADALKEDAARSEVAAKREERS